MPVTYNLNDVKNVIIQLCDLIREYNKSSILYNPQHIRDELATLLGVEKNNKYNIYNLQEYFDNLCELVRESAIALNKPGGQDILVSPINLPIKFKELLEYVPKYNIYFDENFDYNGSGDDKFVDLIPPVEVQDIEQVSHIPSNLPVPYRYRYTFNGWFMNEELTDMVNIGQKLESNITLYAKWIFGKYMVSYETFGGTIIPPAYTSALISQGLLPTPSLRGYTFDGWYKNNSGGLKGTFSDKVENGFVLTNNITLYAKWIPNVYTLTFDVRKIDNPYATDVAPIRAEYYPVFPVLDNIHGYHFMGWTDNLTHMIPIPQPKVGSKIYEDKTYYAIWEYKGFTITFDTNSNGVVKAPEPLQNQTIYDLTKYPTLIWSSHKHTGWAKDREGTIPISQFENLLTDVTIYAIWDRFTLKFEMNGGHLLTSDNQTLTEKEIKVARIPTDLYEKYSPTKFGYQFEGWYLDQNLSTRVVVNQELTSDTTIYAKWVPLIWTLKFDNNGKGTKPEDRMVATSTVYSSSLPILVEPGYEFIGWFDTLDKANNPSQDIKLTEFLVNQNMTLYAGWRANKYDIIFNTSIGKIDETLNVEFIPSEAVLNRIIPSNIGGYEFNGWYTDEKGVYPPLYGTKLISDLYLYAGFIQLIYTITFDTNGGNKLSSILVPYGQLTLDRLPPDPVKPGYNFEYWYYLDASGGEHKVDFDNPYAVASSVTFYAKWENAYFTVYVDNGDATGGDITLTHYTSTHLFMQNLFELKLTKTDYYLEGWYLDPNFDNKITSDFKLISDVYVYAKWSRQRFNINVKYQYPDGVNKEYSDYSTFYFQGAYPMHLIQRPKATGYEFLGWSPSNSDESIITTENYTLIADTTFYGRWKTLTYNINFVENGGTTVNDLNVAFFPNELPLNPTREYYTFDGWYLDSNLQTPFYGPDYYGIKMSQDITLYAKWKEIYYEVYFNTGYSTIKVELPKGVFLLSNIIANPVKTGYDFVGWYNTQNNADLAGTEGLVTHLIQAEGTNQYFYAGYKPQKYEIVYTDLRSFYEIPPWYHYYGSTTRLISSYDDNDTFEGWYLNNNFVGNPITELGPTQFTDSIYLYGKWAGYIWERFTGEIPLIASVDPSGSVFYQGTITITVNGYILEKANMDGYGENWSIEKETSSSITLKAISNEPGSVSYGLDIKFGEIKNYVITFDSNGGSGTMEPQRYETGKVALNANTYTKEGYDFVGWNTAPDGSGTSFPDKQPVSLSSNITLYAQWKLKQFVLNYRISFQDKPNDTGTGHMDYYKLWINNVPQSPIESFANPQRDITVTYGDKIQTWVSTYQGSNRADVIIFDKQGNQIHNSGTQHDVFSPEITINSNIDVHFIFREWTNTDIGDQFLKTQTYWVCRISYKN